VWPERFLNVTNGVTPRRFMVLSNPGLARLLDETVGTGWVTDLSKLRSLEAHVDDANFHERWRRIKRLNKEALAGLLRERTGVTVDPAALFDIQVKRFHEYKRQHLNVLHIITLYQRLRANPRLASTPRCFVFGGKAAPGYRMAKLMIRLINGVASVVNQDPVVAGRLKIAFFPDFNVKNAHAVYPAADLSEQISTAGKEASGTGNMKFTLNGALTIGTMDGANVEIREEVGAENFFLFGLSAADVTALQARGYRPREFYERDAELRAALDLIGSGVFAEGDAGLFRPVIDHLLDHDNFLVLADYRAYVEAQEEVDRVFCDPARWTRMSILNVARAGKFSSDRAIREYGEKIWNVRPVTVAL
jgi:starch phosphorylase